MSPPVLVNVGKGWRLDMPPRRKYFYRAQITHVRVRAMMAKGMDTMQIAAAFKTTEATVWNVMARAGT